MQLFNKGESARQQLQYLYEHKHLLPKVQQKLLYPTLAEHLKISPQQIQTWSCLQFSGLQKLIKTVLTQQSGGMSQKESV
jgi:ABC-type iron transport system FetAB ATPase subunit